jgi:hypothetical protein
VNELGSEEEALAEEVHQGYLFFDELPIAMLYERLQ